MSKPPGFTHEEIILLSLTAAVWNRFLALPSLHPDDIPEFRSRLHDLQRIIMARIGHREMAKNDVADLLIPIAESAG